MLANPVAADTTSAEHDGARVDGGAVVGVAARARESPAAAVTGTANRNEKRAAASRDKPRNSPAVIVTPERDVPGTSASACAQPITTTSSQPIERSSRCCVPSRSAANSSTA